MQAHASIRVVLIGHTDDREAKQFATTDASQPAPDVDALSADLSRARAEAVKNALVAAGIPQPRIIVQGRGFEGPRRRQRQAARPARQPPRRDQAVRPAAVTVEHDRTMSSSGARESR